MTPPTRVLNWMALFVAAVVAVCALLWEPLLDALLANPVFNGMILMALLVGLAINVRQVLVLAPEARWVDAVGQGYTPQGPGARSSPLQALRHSMHRRGERPRLSTLAARTLLDGVRGRLDDSRDLSRYFIGLLIFLGLLGTFWGLLDTLRAIGSVLAGLSPEGQEATALFAALRDGLQEPLAGMGTAFSSSLFGLGGALVLGFIDLQTGHAQNRFYNELEEWLSGYVSTGGAVADGEQAVPAYIEALLEQTADSLDKLQRTMQRAEGQHHGHADEATLQHLRNMDACLMRLLEDMPTHRAQLTDELRSEIRLLARTLAGGRGSGGRDA